MSKQRFKTLREARAFHKLNADKHGWHVRKVHGARVWKYHVGTDIEWLNL